MDFEKIYEGPAVLGKQLEVRWFHNQKIHQMPFMSRTLTYNRRCGRQRKPKLRSSSRRRHRRRVGSTKNINLLRTIFRYKPIRFNKALLSQSKSTRSDSQKRRRKKQRKEEEVLIISSDEEEKEETSKHLEDDCKAFGKQFPTYNPLDESTGICNPPKQPLDAYALFCQMFFEPTRKDLSSSTTINISDEKVEEALKQRWENLEESDILYWKQEECWDQKRYLHEQHICELAISKNMIGSEPYTFSALKSVNWSVSAAVAEELLQKPNLSNFKRNNLQKIKQKQTKVCFHYFYVGEHNKVQVQVEERHDRRCPFCNFNARSDEGLLAHCQTTHGDELSFEGGKDNDGNLHIAVRGFPSTDLFSFYQAPDHLHNFVFVKSRRGQPQKKIPLVKKPICKSVRMDHVARRKMIKQLEANGKTEQISQYLITNKIPVRQYYHSKTNLPMQANEWDYDSDDHPDDGWLHKVSEAMIDEFDDVSINEKKFMKLWNRFIKVHNTIADKHIPKLCMNFIQENNVSLVSNKLRENLLLHLFNLWDQGVVGSMHISQLMKTYDFFANSRQNKFS